MTKAAGADAPPTDELPDEAMPGANTELAVVTAAAAPVPYRGVMTDDELRRTWRVASALAQSGMFPDAQQAPQALAKILMGHDLGLSPTQAMMGIHIVEGKPQLHYATLGGFVRAREGYDYEILERSPEKARVRFTRGGMELGVMEFTIEQAKARGLVKARSNWEKMPDVMCVARALSQGVREYMPEVLGGIPVYVEGEIEVGGEHRKALATGEAEGLDLGPKVEAILIRAEALGHEGLASRPAAEMALGDQSPQVVDLWCANATNVLDSVDPELCRKPAEDGRLCVQPPDHDPPHRARVGEPWTDDEQPDGEAAEKDDGEGASDEEPAGEAEADK